jgi:hypothetical protein
MDKQSHNASIFHVQALEYAFGVLGEYFLTQNAKWSKIGSKLILGHIRLFRSQRNLRRSDANRLVLKDF